MGKKHKEETKKKISDARKLLKISSGRNNHSYNSTKIIQYNKDMSFVKEWLDLVEIRENGWETGKISMVCRNKRKSAYGYIWKYKEKD